MKRMSKGGDQMRLRTLFALAIFPILALLPGCSIMELIGTHSQHVEVPPAEDSAQLEVERLTSNDYQDISPRIAVESGGTVAVLWTSLEMRTPVIKGRFLTVEGWSKEKELGACVGEWDIASRPGDGFLLARTHWGNLYVRELLEGKGDHLVSSGMISSPSILTPGGVQTGAATAGEAYTIWQRKTSEGVNAIQGAILRAGNWTDPIEILTMEKRISRSFLLDGGDRLLLAFVLERDGGSSIYLAELSQELRLANPLRKLRDLGVNYPNLEGGTAADGSFWLAWDGGIREGEQIYVSSSVDGRAWSKPERISMIGARNIDPAIAVDQDFVFVSWVSFDQGGGETDQYGRIRGRWHQVGGNTWRTIEGLYQEENPVLGRDAAVTAGLDRLYLAWEWKGEIYCTTSHNVKTRLVK